MMKNKLTTFYIVRHGETDWNKKKLVQGHKDIVLNETGEKQARDTADKFKDISFDLAFSSDLLRAKRTAEIIALDHKLAVQTTKLLRERQFGRFEGQSSEIFFTQLKLLQKLSHKERFSHHMAKDVENDEEIATRIITFIRETAIAYPGKNILVGTHGGVFHTLIIHLGKITYEESDKLRIRNGGYVKIESDGVDFFVRETIGLEQRGQSNLL